MSSPSCWSVSSHRKETQQSICVNNCSLLQGNHKAALKRSYPEKPAVLGNVFIPSSLCSISLPAIYFGRCPLEMLYGTNEEVAQPVAEL